MSRLKGIKISRGGPSFTHLSFADDLLLFGRPTKKEARVFQNCIDKYCDWSGQLVNMGKSHINVSKNIRGVKAREIIRLLGYKKLSTLAKYLGLPMLFSNSKGRDLHYLTEQVQTRLAGRKAQNLSKAGRTVLP